MADMAAETTDTGLLPLEARLLYTIPSVTAFSIAHGHETKLTPHPSTLNLLIIPTQSAGETYLHLHIDPDIEIPCTTDTTVLYQAPDSYLIPQWNVKTGRYEGEFTRLELGGLKRGQEGAQEDVDVLEMVLGEMTVFRDERPKVPERPTSRRSGSGDDGHAHAQPGQIMLVDNEDGSVLGELSGGYHVHEENIRPGSDEPVVVELPSQSSRNEEDITVHPVSGSAAAADYYNNHPLANSPPQQSPATDSRILKASHYISQFMVISSEKLGRGVESGAAAFTRRTTPAEKPLTFSEATHARVGKAQMFSGQVVQLSARTLGSVTRYAGQLGEKVASRNARGDENNRERKRPGLAYNALQALTQITDSLDSSANQLMRSGVNAASTVVSHRYGDEAGSMARNVGGTIRNAGLVYIDATGVSRKAVVKGAMKGMVVGRLRGGGRGDNGGREVVAGAEAGNGTETTGTEHARTGRDGGRVGGEVRRELRTETGTGTGTGTGTSTSTGAGTGTGTGTSRARTRARTSRSRDRSRDGDRNRRSTAGLKHSSPPPPYSVR